MTVPLATLRRHSQLVWLHDPLVLPPPLFKTAPSVSPATQFNLGNGTRRNFWHADEAEAYLRFWKGDSSAVMSLRSALQKTEPSSPVFHWTDDQVLRQLAARLAGREVLLIESQKAPSPAVMPAAPAPVAVTEPPAVLVSQLLAPKPTAPPLLPILEEVQMEGADVLPEIEQSLEQVDITIGEINLAPVSLEPTPSKVPAISQKMGETAADVTATLDKL